MRAKVFTKIVKACYSCPNLLGTPSNPYCKGVCDENNKYKRLPPEYVEKFPDWCPLQEIEI